jgi:hypothetical protein
VLLDHDDRALDDVRVEPIEVVEEQSSLTGDDEQVGQPW